MFRFYSICVALVLIQASASEPLVAQTAVPWKRECTERRQNLDNTQAKAAAAAASGDQAGVCALIETLENQSWLYCSCAADDGATSRQIDCFKELKAPAEEWKKKFSCAQ